MACPDAFYTYQWAMSHDIRAFQVTGVSKRCTVGSCNVWMDGWGHASWVWGLNFTLGFSRSHSLRLGFLSQSFLLVFACLHAGEYLGGGLGGMCVYSL